jgi:hypothetical protein
LELEISGISFRVMGASFVRPPRPNRPKKPKKAACGQLEAPGVVSARLALARKRHPERSEKSGVALDSALRSE